jgi:hypothetical protein
MSAAATLHFSRAMARRIADEGRTTITSWAVIGPHGAVNWQLMECSALPGPMSLGFGWHERKPLGEGDGACAVFNNASDCVPDSTGDLGFGLGSMYDEYVMGGDDAVYERLEREYVAEWGGDIAPSAPSTPETIDRRHP